MNKARKMRIAFITFVVLTWTAAFVLLAIFNLPLYHTFLMYDGTYFTAGYSEIRYDRIQVGMTEKEVVQLIGEPFDKIEVSTDDNYRKAILPDGGWYYWDDYINNDNYKTDNYIWRYARKKPCNEGSYIIRDVTIKGGRVFKRKKEFYID